MNVDRRLLIGGILAAAVVAAVLIVLLGPGAAPAATATPEQAFAAALERIRAGDYDGVWGLLSERMRKSWSDGVAVQKRAVENAGENRAMMENLLVEQYGVRIARFLPMTPRELYAAVLERNRETVLGYTIAGPVKITGDRAVLRVRARPDEPALPWTYVRDRDGRWRLDEAEAVKKE